jgi:M6 family metalloprotease-like protein
MRTTMLTPDRPAVLARLCALALFSALALLALAPAALALEPPDPGELARYAADGTLAARLARARSLGNAEVAPGLVGDAVARLQRAQLGVDLPLELPPPAWRGMPTKGTVRVLALLIDFSDTRHTTPADGGPGSVADKLFGEGAAADEPYESLHDYYARSSYGQLDIEGDVLGWYNTGKPRSAVAQTDAGREALIETALRFYDATTDFSRYDNDGDGAVDYLLVVWSGAANGWSGFWWGYQTSFADRAFALDGTRLGTYSWQWEARPWPGEFRPEVAIHETGHALGLPDYYDYDSGIGPDGGVGGLDMMDDDWGDHNGFSKFLLDWVDPTRMSSGSATVTLAPSATAPEDLVVMPGIGTSPFQEYFLVQYRRRVGNDVALPTDGLLVWHVDARLSADGSDFRYDNSWTAHKLLRLMEADGLEEIERGGRADAGDFYRVGDVFAPGTSPGSHRYDGARSGVAVGGISAAAETITFDASTEGGGGGDTAPPSTLVVGADRRWHNQPVTLTFVAGDAGSGVALTEYRVGEGDWVVADTVTFAAPADTHAGDGVYTVTYRSVDLAGNAESEKQVLVRIDTLGPSCSAPRAAAVVRGRTAALRCAVYDALSPRADVKIVVRDAAGDCVKIVRASGVPTGSTLTLRFRCRLPRGRYRFQVRAVDLAGNRQVKTAWQSLRVS